MVSKGKIRLKGGGVEIAACLGGKEREIFLLQNISISNSLSTDFLDAFYKRMKRFIIKFNFRFKKNGWFQLNKSSIIKYKLKQIIFHLFWFLFK